MRNLKIIDKNRLLSNLKHFQDKKICAMVKANAYGHGLKEVVEILKEKVDYFGVSNEDEGLCVRKLTQKPILLCSKVDDFEKCKQSNLEFFVEDRNDVENAVKFGLRDNCHLKIDCGMNRYGEDDESELKKLDYLFENYEIKLKSICTHFSNTTCQIQTKKQYEKFLKLRKSISQDAEICFGGSGVAKYNFHFDMLRLGIALYGYENENCEPVMRVKSKIIKVFKAKKGEHIGYGKKYRVKEDGLFAIVPMGYADGVSRNFSSKIFVEINGRQCPIVGNVCMDCFFVKCENACEGDDVVFLQNAENVATKLSTIPYEILTGFSKMRGMTKVE